MTPSQRGGETQKIRVGIGDLDTTIEVPARTGDAPAWSLDTKFRHVGKDTPRFDGPDKASGRAKYPSDVAVPGMLHAVIVRSEIAAGSVEKLDTTAASKAPGVRGIEVQTGPGRKIRYLGQELLAIAADTRQQARDAARLVEVGYGREEHAVAPEDGIRADLPANPVPAHIRDTGPMQGDGEIELSYVFETPVQMHHPLEPHGVTCIPNEDGSLLVHPSTQGTFSMRRAIARTLGMPENRVVVDMPIMGGGFGGKLTAGVEAALCAKLAMQTKKPVRLFVDREAEATAVGNRPSSIQKITGSCDRNGKLTGWSLTSWGFPGYGGSGRVAFPRNYFRDVRMERPGHQDVPGNTGSARAFRAPGHPQGYFACEGMIDELACRAGIDPVEFRKKNLERDPVHRRQLEICAEAIEWQKHFRSDPSARGDGRVLEGVGCAIANWGGLGGGNSSVACRIHEDGTVEVRNGAQDIGTGTRTLLGLVAAETLGVPLDRIRVALGNTNDPVGTGSGGSRTAPTLAPAARHAAWLAGRELAARVAERKGLADADVRFEDGAVHAGKEKLDWAAACALLGKEPVEAMGRRFRNFRNGFANGAAGAQAAHVAVDLDTGIVTVKKIVAVQDCGLVVDKLLAESQVIGAVIQGLSYALYEERLTHPALGQVINRDFEYFKIAGIKEMPEIVPILQVGNNGHNNAGVVGLGEPPTIPTAAAIANALRNACGLRFCRIPLTPARVFDALNRTKGAC